MYWKIGRLESGTGTVRLWTLLCTWASGGTRRCAATYWEMPCGWQNLGQIEAMFAHRYQCQKPLTLVFPRGGRSKFTSLGGAFMGCVQSIPHFRAFIAECWTDRGSLRRQTESLEFPLPTHFLSSHLHRLLTKLSYFLCFSRAGHTQMLCTSLTNEIPVWLQLFLLSSVNCHNYTLYSVSLSPIIRNLRD